LKGPENRTFSEEIKRDFEGAEKVQKSDQPSSQKVEAAKCRLTLCLFFLKIYCSPRAKRTFALRELR